MRWPFWLLVLAWFCANSPQSLTYEAIVWAKGMERFSHQARLAVEVCVTLSGREAPKGEAITRAAPERETLPVVPPEATVKKIVLSTQAAREGEALCAGHAREIFGHGVNWKSPATPSPDTPHPPPRYRLPA